MKMIQEYSNTYSTTKHPSLWWFLFPVGIALVGIAIGYGFMFILSIIE